MKRLTSVLWLSAVALLSGCGGTTSDPPASGPPPGNPPPPQSQSYTILHTFKGGAEGSNPNAGLIRDEAGNLYGTTAYDGDFVCGCGTVFKIDPGGTLTTLHVFAGGATDGASPYAGLIRDEAGNLYGTTVGGGTHQFGTVFKLDASGTETVLYHFTGGADGGFPSAGVIRDAEGNLYGTTAWCGELPCSETNVDGAGTIFKLDPTGALTTMHPFAAAGTEGTYPNSSLIRDAAGNLYGTTFYGGDINPFSLEGLGTVFRLNSNGAFTTLHAFSGAEGEFPSGPLIQDGAGNFYGTTSGGGRGLGGIVFKLDVNGQMTTLLSFSALDGGEESSDPGGQNPTGRLLLYGNHLYGTTTNAGTSKRGVAFGLNTESLKETVLYTFRGRGDGGEPNGGLVTDNAGNLYGITNNGGDLNCHPPSGCGVVFKLKLR